MISCKHHLILCLQIMSISMAPLQLQFQSQLSMQPSQEELLQQQLFALQQFQNLQMLNQWNGYQQPGIISNQAPAPMMIILPERLQLSDLAQMKNLNNNKQLHTKNSEEKDKESINEDLDSVIIEAEPQQEPKPETEPMKVVLLIPNRRTFTIGGIISAIPFLPIEVNVPDAISWIYDGISGIISGIGNRFPIKKPVQTSDPMESNNASMKLLIQRLQNQNRKSQAPILMLPDVAQMYPMPIPMQF